MRDLPLSVEEQRCGQVNSEGCLKTPADLDRYREVIFRTRPDSILETGTFSGKSALWFARQAGHPKVLTVDKSWACVDDPTWEAATASGVLFYRGGSTDDACVEFVRDWARQAGRLMVVLDSDHSAGHVYTEMCVYAPLVSPGCYLVVEDGIIRWIPHELAYYGGTGPLDAIERWLAEQQDTSVWQVDSEVENRTPTTQFPSGWLKRLR